MSFKFVQLLRLSSRLVGRRGFHRSTALCDQPAAKFIAGSNAAPKYKKIDPDNNYDDLEPEYLKNDNYFNRIFLTFLIIILCRQFWKRNEFIMIRSEMELAEFVTAEKEKQLKAS
ncbi:uncharacterized protein LOC128393213 [Panonychus citri]|uniref:uncharacterized protein LOC128393213 n=1 Tax=Panonychus citri TaxID=50023 RepID=UPI0023073134|nr:uncharacterized protein LOC128393213 [Panonychus citri]